MSRKIGISRAVSLLLAAFLLFAALASANDSNLSLEKRQYNHHQNNNNRHARPNPYAEPHYNHVNRPARNHINRPLHADHARRPHFYRPGMHRFVSPNEHIRNGPASHLVSLPPELRVGSATQNTEDATTPRSRNHAFALKADTTLAEKAGSSATEGLRGNGFSLKAFEKLHSYYGALEIYTVPTSEGAAAAAAAGQGEASAASAGEGVQPVAQLSSNATGNAGVDSAINTITNPLAWLNTINWGSSIVAIVLIIFGVLMAFAGFALFKIILFVAGFYSFSLLAVFILDLVAANLQGDQLTTFNNNSAIIFGVCVIVMGIIGGALFLCLWRLGLFFIGALLGYTIGTFILTVAGSSFIPSETWRYVFIGAIALVFAIAILFIEKPLLIISTSISGAFALTMGIDVFTQTGFVAAVTGVAQNVSANGGSAIESGVKSVFSGSTMVMAIVFVVVAAVGIVVQFVVSGRSQGKGRFSHAAYDGKPRPGVKGWGYNKAVPTAEKV